jgi:hypothetical protein
MQSNTLPFAFSVPGWVFSPGPLPVTDKLAMVAVCLLCARDGRCPSRPETVASVSGLSLEEAKGALARMSAAGWIRESEAGAGGVKAVLPVYDREHVPKKREAPKKVFREKPNDPDYREVNEMIMAVYGTMDQKALSSHWERKAARRLIASHGTEAVAKAMASMRSGSKDRFCPIVRSCSELEKKWDSVERFCGKERRGGALVI